MLAQLKNLNKKLMNDNLTREEFSRLILIELISKMKKKRRNFPLAGSFQAAPHLNWLEINYCFLLLFFAEHVWEVNVIGRGLGEKHGILGPYRFCITESSITLIRVGQPAMPTGETRVEQVEFSLANMRR